MSDVAPPDLTEWWDLAARVDACLAMLRLQEGDVDEMRLAELVPAAGAQITNRIDSEDPIVATPELNTALELLTCELYHRQQGGGIVPSGFPAVGGHRDAVDPSYGLTGPSKRRFGVA